jgi:transposase
MELKKKRKQFSRHCITQVLAELESGYSRTETCEKYGIGHTTLREWIVRYGSKEYLATTKQWFTDQQRRSVVRNVVEGRMTIPEANLAYKIKGKRTISGWIKKYDLNNDDIDLKQSIMVPSSDSLQQDLQKALTASRLKVLALETMIDVAEQELKIKIRKKSGARQ